MTTNTTEWTKKGLNVRKIAMIAMLAAISFVLAFLEFPVPLSPSLELFLCLFELAGLFGLARADWGLCLRPGGGRAD